MKVKTSKPVKRNGSNDNKAKLEAQLLLAKYVKGLKRRQQGCSRIIDGSQTCADALDGLTKYYKRFPDIKAKVEAETEERLCDAMDYLDMDVSKADLDTGELQLHFAHMAEY
jgi:hypothetical protein